MGAQLPQPSMGGGRTSLAQCSPWSSSKSFCPNYTLEKGNETLHFSGCYVFSVLFGQGRQLQQESFSTQDNLIGSDCSWSQVGGAYKMLS